MCKCQTVWSVVWERERRGSASENQTSRVQERESNMTNLLQHATHQRSVWCLSSVHEYVSQSLDVCQWQSHQLWALDSERSSRSPPALPSPSRSCHRQHCSVNIAFCKSSSDYTTLSRTFNSFLELCLHQIILQIFSLSVCFGLGTCNTAQVSMLKARKFSSVARQISYLADMDNSTEIFCQSFLFCEKPMWAVTSTLWHVRPAFPLPTMASPTLKGSLRLVWRGCRGPWYAWTIQVSVSWARRCV